jgi:monoamine oxidase
MSKLANRREFLQFVTTIGGSGLLPAFGTSQNAVADSGPGCNGKRVVILGGGLAGLTAAYKLMNQRYEVIVLEGQDRVGGRVLTVRDGLKGNGHVEMGATRIFSTHSATLKYVEHFKLGPLVPYDSGKPAFYMRGRRFVQPPADQPWPIADMSDAEKANPFAFLGPYLGAGFKALGNLESSAWPDDQPTALHLDEITLEQYLLNQGASRGWIDWFCALEGNIKRINACAGFAVVKVSAGREGEPPASIAGGNDRLPKAFAAALGSLVKLKCKVVRLEQSAREVAVTYVDTQGRQNQVRADRCVCALPFSTLRKVTIAPAFADDKMHAIESLRYMAAARSHFQTRTRFWTSDPLGSLGGLNLVGTDGFAGRIWNTSSQQANPVMGMIHAYMFDVEASEYAALPDRIDATRQHISDNLLPGLTPDQVVASADKVWQDDPWVEGGWGSPGLNEMRDLHQARRRAEGRVHFAGDHTSKLWLAWMNGAIESGERAADEIIATGC